MSDSAAPPAASPVIPAPAAADTAPPITPAAPEPKKDPFNEDRIMKVMPDYQTVRDPNAPDVTALTARQKWQLAWKETVDPFNIASAAMAAGFSQAAQQTPKYGVGAMSYTERFAAANADFATQNFFSVGLAILWRQDPRYFRRGPSVSVPGRVWYAITRVFVCETDDRHTVVNSSGLVGMALGIAASNLYYPPASRKGEVMAGRVQTSLFGNVIGNITSEFWPDIEKRFFHKKEKTPTPQP